jgi:hypothetical protein
VNAGISTDLANYPITQNIPYDNKLASIGIIAVARVGRTGAWDKGPVN